MSMATMCRVMRKTAWLAASLSRWREEVLALVFTPLGEVFPSVLGGFIMAGVGMLVGSLLPTQGNRAHHAAGHHARVHGHAH